MSERDHESRENRQREDHVRNGDAGEGDNRHPDQVEDRNHYPDRFRAQPIQPADAKLALLLARQPSDARQQMAPVLPQDLEAAIGPPMALLLESIEGVGQETMPVASIGVMDLPALL